MRVLRIVLLLAVAPVFCGHGSCEYNRYLLQMKPVEEGLWRKLSLRRIGSEGQKTEAVDFPAEELDQISMLYPIRLGLPDGRSFSFEGSFARELPTDIGGFGRFLKLESSFGRVLIYSERIRGVDDQATLLANAARAANRLMDFVIGWMELHLKGKPGFDRLRAFLDQQARADFANLVLYGGLASRLAEYQPAAEAEMGVRGIQFLVERGYFDVAEVPKLSRAFYRAEVDERALELMAWLQRLLARKMGVPDSQPIPEALSFLGDAKKAADSFEDYLKTTPEFVKLKKQVQDKNQAPPPEVPKVSDVLEPLLFDLTGFDLDSPDHLTVKLSLPTAPFSTNGTWDDKAHAVLWEDKPIVGRTALPTFFYAAQSEPDARFQIAHFGKVVLKDMDLAEYTFWRQGLTEEEGREWEGFLKGLKPGKELASRVEAFRFFGEKRNSPQPPVIDRSLSDLPRRLLAAGLTSK